MKHRIKLQWLLPLTAWAFLSACQPADDNAAAANAEQPPLPVDVVTLETQAVNLQSSLPARTIAYRMAEVRPQVNGIIEKRLFEEGSDVEAGQQLYQIEPALYEAAVASAKAGLARAEAALQTAKAKQARYKSLLDDNAISRQEYDDALASYEQAQAEIQVQKAAIKTAQTNLDYTKVNAPISGRISKSNVTEGALVTAQQANVLATIHQLDPIYVDISQPSKELLRLRKRIIDREINAEKAPAVTLTLEDGSTYPLPGKLQFAEVNVDPNTGDVVLRAIMPNPEKLLLPGMYVRAEVQEGTINNAILVPQSGVAFDRSGNATAMVVGKDNTAELRQLIIDRAIGSNWLVSSGLQAGDQVIVSNLQKLAPGAPVDIEKAVDSNSAVAADNGQNETAAVETQQSSDNGE